MPLILRSLEPSLEDASYGDDFRRQGWLYLPDFFDLSSIRAFNAAAAQAARSSEIHCHEEAVSGSDNNTVVDELTIESVNDALLSRKMLEIAREILGGEVDTFDGFWIRFVSPGGGCSPHRDVQFTRCDTDVLTAWIPLTRIPFDCGGLRILDERSDPPVWLTSTYCPGDLLLFDQSILHGATANALPAARVSLDVRFSLSTDRTNPKRRCRHVTVVRTA